MSQAGVDIAYSKDNLVFSVAGQGVGSWQQQGLMTCHCLRTPAQLSNLAGQAIVRKKPASGLKNNLRSRFFVSFYASLGTLVETSLWSSVHSLGSLIWSGGSRPTKPKPIACCNGCPLPC